MKMMMMLMMMKLMKIMMTILTEVSIFTFTKSSVLIGLIGLRKKP